MTKKQRLEIYKKAYRLMFKKHDGICWHLHYFHPVKNIGFITLECVEKFPEFAMFQPPSVNGYWFGTPHFRPEGKEIRLTVLAFCIAFCENNDV